MLENQKTVTLSCYYSDGVPVSYAATLVFSPDDPDTEYQNGRTDRAGMFAFVPDKAGVWRIETSDGMGHKVEKSVEVENLPGPVDSSLPDRGAASPAIISAFLGVSLIFNIFFGIALIRKKTGRLITILFVRNSGFRLPGLTQMAWQPILWVPCIPQEFQQHKSPPLSNGERDSLV